MKHEVFLNTPVCRVTRVREKTGKLFGLELELEGRNVALQDVPTRGWQRTMDGSLRGESVEFITSGGHTYDETVKLVTSLFKKFEDNGVRFNDSIRTSTHVHLNFCDKPMKAVINFFSLFTLLEEVLQYYSGEDRKGNLFCISTREAEGIIGILSSCIEKMNFDMFAGDRYKYSACNLSTLYKFGTVEVRTMRGAKSAGQVNNWLSIVNDLYEYALKMKSPAELIQDLSLLGAERLMRKVFSPKNYDELMKTFPAPRTLHQSLMDGARLLQVFAFEYEEAFTKEVKLPPRGKETVLPRMIHRPGHILHGSMYRIYRPDGIAWNCTTRHGGDFQHGDKVADEPRIEWDGNIERFIVRYPDRVYVCKWHYHHEIEDEGPLPRDERQAMPRPWLDPEAPDWDDDEDVEFDEGDEI